ncbi:MAG: DUF2939 domain-containing protein [Hyphomicrobiales bacterium]
MRKYLFGAIAFLALAIAYQAWPLLGAAQLASAARSGDARKVLERVELPALRTQLTRQIVRAYLEKTGRAPKGAFERNIAINIGTSIAEPYVAEMLTPENLASLLRNGRIAGAAGQSTLLSGEKLPNFSELLDSGLWTTFARSHFDGWTSYLIKVAGDETSEGFGVHLHLVSGTWRLSGIDLPKSLVARVVEEVILRDKSS